MAILDGFIRTKRYRKTNDGYILQSEAKHESSVFFEDGSTLTEKITEVQNGLSTHEQSASTITAGTFKGDVVAAESSAFSTPHISNFVIVDTKPTVGTDAPYPIGTFVRVKK